MTTFGTRLHSAFMAEAQAKGRRLDKDEIIEVADRQFKIAQKERKRAGIDERAASILNCYPRREGGDASLISITKAIEKDGFDLVLAKTTEYASAVARWSHARRKSQSGSSLIPLPTTFYNNRRYTDDPKAWWEGTGGREAVKEKPKLKEPQGWRFAHPHSRFVTENTPWEAIDETSQRWIIQNTPNQQTA